jgi:hypothetical protein
MGKPMPAEEIARLRKVHALFNSPAPGEAASARSRAEALLKPHGLTLDDIPKVLNPPPAPVQTASSSFNDFFANIDDRIEEQHPGWKAQQAAAAAERTKQKIKDRAEILARYGSVEAAIAPCDREKLLRKAVKKWSTFCDPPHQRWTKAIDGYSDGYSAKNAPKRVIAALSAAYPLPTSITEAAAEYAYWRSREREISLALDDGDSGEALDLTAELRHSAVCDLVDHGLKAANVGDVLARLQALLDKQMMLGSKDIAPMLADLERLAAQEAKAATKPETRAKPAKQQVNGKQPDLGF